MKNKGIDLGTKVRVSKREVDRRKFFRICSKDR